MVKYFCVFIKSKNLKHYEKRFQQKILLFRSSHSQMFLQKRSSEENSQNSQKNCLKFYWKRYPEREPFKSFSQAVSLDIIIKTSKWHQFLTILPALKMLWKPPSRTSFENIEYFQGRYLWCSCTVLKKIFVVGHIYFTSLLNSADGVLV